MKSQDQITACIAELGKRLKPGVEDPRRHMRGRPGHKGNLGTPRMRRLEGAISALEWVMEANGSQFCDI